jgi:3-dehydrosphinganine reductase
MADNLNYWALAGIGLVSLLLIPTIMGFFGGNKFIVKGKVQHESSRSRMRNWQSEQTVLLTGASEGMGKSVAKQLAAKGANIIIVARNVGKLEEALGQIKVRLTFPTYAVPC